MHHPIGPARGKWSKCKNEIQFNFLDLAKYLFLWRVFCASFMASSARWRRRRLRLCDCEREAREGGCCGALPPFLFFFSVLPWNTDGGRGTDGALALARSPRMTDGERRRAGRPKKAARSAAAKSPVVRHRSPRSVGRTVRGRRRPLGGRRQRRIRRTARSE